MSSKNDPSIGRDAKFVKNRLRRTPSQYFPTGKNLTASASKPAVDLGKIMVAGIVTLVALSYWAAFYISGFSKIPSGPRCDLGYLGYVPYALVNNAQFCHLPTGKLTILATYYFLSLFVFFVSFHISRRGRSKMRIFDDDRRYRLVMTKLFKILLLTAWILAPFGGGRFDGRDLTNGSIFPFFLTISFIYISDATLVTLGYKKNRDI